MPPESRGIVAATKAPVSPHVRSCGPVCPARRDSRGLKPRKVDNAGVCAGNRRGRRIRLKEAQVGRAVQLRMTLADINPGIWREVLVSDSVTLPGLHRVIQAAFGWQDYH